MGSKNVDLQYYVTCMWVPKMLKHSLALVMNDFDYATYEVEQSLVSNSSLRVVQAQDTLQIRWPQCAVICDIVFLHCIAVKEAGF